MEGEVENTHEELQGEDCRTGVHAGRWRVSGATVHNNKMPH